MHTRRSALAAICGIARASCLAQGNSPSIEVPARLNCYNQLLIPVSANNGPKLWCLLDTGGATHMYLSKEKAAQAGITASYAGRSAGPITSDYPVDGRALVTLDVGGVHLTNHELIIKTKWPSPEEGVIGTAVFSSSIIELDFQAPAVRFHSAASFRYRGPGGAIPFEIWSFNPHIVASLAIDKGDPVKARMTVDTGAPHGAAYLTPKFDSELRRLGHALSWVRETNGFSTCSIASIAVGRFAIERPLIHLLPTQGFGSNPNAPDGVLGVEFLRHYRVFIDYTKKEMILEPNAAGAKARDPAQ